MNRRILAGGRSRLAATVSLLATLFTVSCDSTEPRRAAALAIATQPSNSQSGVALAQPVVVEVRDQEGAPFAQSGVSVTVSIADGGGTLGGTTTQTTNAEGRATFPDLVLSGTVGPRTLRFSATGLTAATSSPITLTPGPAATLEAQSAATAQATVATAVATPPSVVVKDASGNGVPGVAVTFAVASGGGEITGATQTTNASGVATLGGWTLPTTTGQYTVTATAAGVSGNGITFTATATPDAPSAMQPSGGGQSALYGSRLPTPVQVRVVDKYANPVPGVVVTWGSFTGAGTVEPINVSTDADGIVRSNYRLGTTPGGNVIRASINSLGLHVDIQATALGFTDQLGVAVGQSCALDETGVAYCWGSNNSGEIGDGSTTNRATPTAVGGALRFRRLSAGQDANCALTVGNVAYCWGTNAYAALGDGSTTNRGVPTRVSGDHPFTEIATSGVVACALTAAGAAYCWGSNEIGQLGVGAGAQVETCVTSARPQGFPCSRQPVQVTGGLTFTSITAGSTHVCALTAAQDLYCWGHTPAWGGSNGPAPEHAASGFKFSQVTAGSGYTCGIVGTSAYCWGSENYGTLGDGGTDQQQNSPALVANIGSIGVSRIDAGFIGTCAVVSDGRAFCWGNNDSGGVGDGTTTLRTTPSGVASGATFTAISPSGFHSCGRITTGQMYCWGANPNGELGNGGGAGQLTPVLVRP